MTAINHTFVQQNTPQLIESSYADISGAIISNTYFTAGKKYLIVVTAQLYSATDGAEIALQLFHGSTQFGFEQRITLTSPQVGTYNQVVVWTAVGGEDVKLSGKCAVDGYGDQIALFAMCLSDDLIENTDWFYNYNSPSLGLTNAYQTVATITFTPSVAGQDWLVIASNDQLGANVADGGTETYFRLDRSGEATSDFPEWHFVPRNSGGDGSWTTQAIGRVFNLGNASNTFKAQAKLSSGTDGECYNAAIFALNLNKFRNHVSAYTEADQALSASAYATQIQTVSITPDVISDVWIGAYWGFAVGDASRVAQFRVQLDNSDLPAGQTTDARNFRLGDAATDVPAISLSTMSASLAASGHTIDMDASADSTTGAPVARHRSLWAVTMELAPTTVSPNVAETLGAIVENVQPNLLNMPKVFNMRAVKDLWKRKRGLWLKDPKIYCPA